MGPQERVTVLCSASGRTGNFGICMEVSKRVAVGPTSRVSFTELRLCQNNASLRCGIPFWKHSVNDVVLGLTKCEGTTHLEVPYDGFLVVSPFICIENITSFSFCAVLTRVNVPLSSLYTTLESSESEDDSYSGS